MTLLALFIGLAGISFLYETALDEQKTRLAEIVQSKARLMEAVARFDAIQNPEYPGGSEAATISQIKDAHARFQGFGETGEFTLAKRVGDQISFVLKYRHNQLEEPSSIPFDSHLAEPMRLALSGQSGIVIDHDYRGEVVMAAYEPVAVLNMGVVAKIDLAEVRAPFLYAVISWIVVTFGLMTIGIILFFKVGYPFVREIQESEENLTITLNSIGDAVISTNEVGQITRMNQVAEELTGWLLSEVRGRPLSEVFKIVNSVTGKPVPNPAEIVLTSGNIVGLANHTALISKHGEHHQIADSGAPIRNHAGEIMGVVLVFRDVTKEYQIQKELQDNETRFRELFNNMGSGVAIYEVVNGGENFIFKDINPAGERISNTTKEAVYGRLVTDAFPEIKSFGLFDIFQKVHKTGQTEFHPITVYQDQRIKIFGGKLCFQTPDR